jgi:hypothetical protein
MLWNSVGFWADGRQPFLYPITEESPVIEAQSPSWEHRCPALLDREKHCGARDINPNRLPSHELRLMSNQAFAVVGLR